MEHSHTHLSMTALALHPQGWWHSCGRDHMACKTYLPSGPFSAEEFANPCLTMGLYKTRAGKETKPWCAHPEIITQAALFRLNKRLCSAFALQCSLHSLFLFFLLCFFISGKGRAYLCTVSRAHNHWAARVLEPSKWVRVSDLCLSGFKAHGFSLTTGCQKIK